jgi:putative transposase
MYEYRDLCEQEQLAVVRDRMRRGRPTHSPPHSAGAGVYIISAACWEHQSNLVTEERRAAFARELLQAMGEAAGGVVRAWVVLPNHYHALWEGNLDGLRPILGGLHNGTATRWNREDQLAGRRVWYRFSDRRVRSDDHYYAAVNYIHANPVKHGWSARADAWSSSSLRDWLRAHGREQMVELWRQHPPGEFGRGWDD